MQRIKDLLVQRKQQWWENPLPSEDSDDQIIFFQGMVDGIVMALDIHLTEEELVSLNAFVQELCGIDDDDD